ncbi:hypothetical protein FPQ18DRAFT_397075 [Pyronema domesticum]|nr:hypothetical protein FPQ18DRAFT_397075 [Pyronema domesticum]
MTGNDSNYYDKELGANHSSSISWSIPRGKNRLECEGMVIGCSDNSEEKRGVIDDHKTLAPMHAGRLDALAGGGLKQGRRSVEEEDQRSINSPVYFEKSSTCEPSWTGLYLQSHYHQKLPLSTGANVSLMFTGVRASYSLFDRSDTLHKKTPSSGLSSAIKSPGAHPPAKKDTIIPPKPSAQTTGFDDLDFTTCHGGDNAILRAIRDVAVVGQQLITSKNEELVLKSMSIFRRFAISTSKCH